jgi:hypothetical protein
MEAKGFLEEKQVKALKEYAAATAKQRDAALKAQQSKTLDGELPETMQDGVWGSAGKPQSEWKADHINEVTKKPWQMFMHQIQAINWMKVIKRGILALDAGMGKTPTVISFMEMLKAERAKEGDKSTKPKRAILFLPPSLMSQWPQEIEKYAPGSKDKILNLYGMTNEQRKIALKSPMAQNAEYILVSTGVLNDPKAKDIGKKKGHKIQLDDGSEAMDNEALNDGTGGMDNEMVQALRDLDGAVFVDEVHQGGYKTASSVRHRLLSQVMEGREYAMGMSATPVPNHPMDLYNLINLFAPGTVGSAAEWAGKLHKTQFNEETQSWEHVNTDDILEMNKRIKPYVFAKLITDKEVADDMDNQLPALISKAVDLKPSESKCKKTGFSQLDWLRPGGVCEMLAAQKIQEKMAEREAKGEDPYSEGVLALMFKGMMVNLQRQAAISPALLDPRYTGPAPKIDKMVNDIWTHFLGGASDRPIVCFSSFPQKAWPLVKKKLLERGIDPSRIGMIEGTKSPRERAMMQDFTNSGKIKILLVGTLSGGAGLNLQKKANKMLFLDEPWHPAAKRQAQGRVHRIGQKETTHMHTYRIMGAYDMNMEERIAGKQVMTTALLGAPDPDIFKDKANDQIKELLGRITKAGAQGQQMSHLVEMAGELKLDESLFGEEFSHKVQKEAKETDDEDDEGLDDDEEAPMQNQANLLGRITAAQTMPELPPDIHPAFKQFAPKKIPALTEKFDIAGESKKWRKSAMMREARSRYDLFMTSAQIAEEKGDSKTARECRVKASEKAAEVRAHAHSLEELAKQKPPKGATPKELKEHEETVKEAKKEAASLRENFPQAWQGISEEARNVKTDGAKPAKGEKAEKPAKQEAKPAAAPKEPEKPATGSGKEIKYHPEMAKEIDKRLQADNLDANEDRLRKQAEKHAGTHDFNDEEHYEAARHHHDKMEEIHASRKKLRKKGDEAGAEKLDAEYVHHKLLRDGHGAQGKVKKEERLKKEAADKKAAEEAAKKAAQAQAGGTSKKPAPATAAAPQKTKKHTSGVEHFGKKLDFPSDEADFGHTGLNNDTAHYFWEELHKNKHKSLEEFADKIMKPVWDKKVDGAYTTKKAASRMREVLGEFKKRGFVHSYPGEPAAVKKQQFKGAVKDHPAGYKVRDVALPVPVDEKAFTTANGVHISNDVSHYLWDKFRKGKHKSVEQFADKVMKDTWDDKIDGKYTTKRAATVMRKLLSEMARHGVVEE